MNEKLKSKIVELFEYRAFPYLFELSGATSEKATSFTQKLIDLQASIYYLDAHLESNWKTDEKTLNHCWNNIYDNLNTFNIDKKEFHIYTSHIRKYQKHELELRDNILPTRFKMEFFYFYKSCDVKLLRKLIYRAFPKLNKMASLSDWRYFDLVTEVNDDVEDIFEDITTINGNRFLISMIKNGHSLTIDKFSEFLDYIKDKSTSKFNEASGDLTNLIHQSTIENVIITKGLAKQNLKKFLNIDHSNIELFKHLNACNSRRSA